MNGSFVSKLQLFYVAPLNNVTICSDIFIKFIGLSVATYLITATRYHSLEIYRNEGKNLTAYTQMNTQMRQWFSFSCFICLLSATFLRQKEIKSDKS